MKRIICIIVSALLLLSVAGCANKTNAEPSIESQAQASSSESTPAESEPPAEKKRIKVYGKVVEYVSGPMMTDALIEKLKDKYIIDAIQVDWTNQDTVIRTGIASGDPCDIYNYEPKRMLNFADMAVDLKPYLDADPEWSSQYSSKDLEAGSVDGRYLAIPWESNFTVVLANKEMLDNLGITIPDSWTMDEFNKAAKIIKDAGFFPFANANDLNRGDWVYRNAFLSTVVSAGKYEELTRGDLPFTGPETIKALEKTKYLFDNNYMYPGEGAVTVKNDEIKAAFYQGKIAMIAEIAAGSKISASEAEFEVVLAPWPSADSHGAILGGYNGFFIPKNVKDVDAAVEVLKAFTSPDILAIHAKEGYIPTCNKIEITDPFVKQVAHQADTLYPLDFPSTVEYVEYLAYNLIPDLVLNGGIDIVTANLEAIREEYLSSK